MFLERLTDSGSSVIKNEAVSIGKSELSVFHAGQKEWTKNKTARKTAANRIVYWAVICN